MFEFLHVFLNKTQAKQPNFCIPLETSLNDGKRNYIDLLKLEIAAWIFICTYSDVEIDFRYSAIHHRLAQEETTGNVNMEDSLGLFAVEPFF